MAAKATTPAAAAARWRPYDPGRASLRRALRAALVIPPAFAFALLVARDVQVTTFVAFGCFALIVMADYGGPRRARAAAYAVTTLVGAVLVALGTLASPTAWLAALLMLLVAFSVQFASVFGSYAAAGQSALLLSFVLAVSIPAPPAAVGSRLVGWLIAGAVSTLAAVLLWPRFERVRLRQEAAAACLAMADLVSAEYDASRRSELPQRRQAAAEAVDALRREYAATAKRPAGPTRRDRAFVELLTELDSTVEFANRLYDARLFASRPCIEEGDRLAAALVRVLRAAAGVLTGGPPPDLRGLEQARAAHREALDRWAAGALRAGEPPERVLDGLDADHALRILSYLALALGASATIAAGGNPTPDLGLPAGAPREGAGRVMVRVGRTIQTHLEPTSSVLHNSVRAAIGLALAVLLARLLRLDHAFWVVLGTASVLRTNALATGRTTMEAIEGTLAGFALGAVLTAVVGTNTAFLWAALPVTTFLAAYASGAVGFVVGQAAFTINVLILFNLITPVGWRLGLARIEDVAVGVGISVVAGLLLWPRGARRELSRALAGCYRGVVVYLARSFARVLEGTPRREVGRARLVAVRARDRAGEAFEQFLNERASKPLDPRTAGFLVASGGHAIAAGDMLNVVADMGYRADGCPPGAEALSTESGEVLSALIRLADRLDDGDGGDEPAAELGDDRLRRAALTCLGRWREDPSSGRSAIAVAAAGEWVALLRSLCADLKGPVTEAARAARVPWWR